MLFGLVVLIENQRREEMGVETVSFWNSRLGAENVG